MNVHLPRLSRLRRRASTRALLTEIRLHPQDLIAPLFISAKLTEKKAIAAMPGQYQLTLADLPAEIDALSALGIPAVLLFGIPAEKDACGSQAIAEDGIVQQAIRRIRQINPEMLIIADLCFCEYTDHGHCGVMEGEHLAIDPTLSLLGQQAVSLARAGADWVAPSGMVDGMVGAVRQALDQEGFTETAILSYAAKYCSNLYGPFREAAEGAPQFGDRKSYQMNPANALEAVREAALDIEESADLIMVKPAGFYLDIIHSLKSHFPEVPLCAYQVSGEYSMLKLAIEQGLLPEAAILESLIAIKRAGADCLITYFAKEIASSL